MKLSEIAARIHAHLKRFEADPEINAERVLVNHRGQPLRLKPFYFPAACSAGRFVYVTYVTYQGQIRLTRDQASVYLEKLDSGFVGKHYEALKDGPPA